MSGAATYTGASWTPARAQLHRDIAARDVELAELYAGLVARLGESPRTPAQARERLLMISHAVRELVTCLPATFGADDPGRADVSAAAADLAQQWEWDDNALGAPDPQRFASDPNAPTSVRRGLVAAAAAVTREQRRGGENNRRRQAATVLGRPAGPDDPTLRRWSGAQQWFNRHAHLDRSRQSGRSVPDDVDILAQLTVVEDILSARLRGFFEVMRELDALIDEANEAASTSQEPGGGEAPGPGPGADANDGADAADPDPAPNPAGLAAPTDELVDRAMNRIGDLTHRRAFYERLDNPHWVAPLHTRRAFRRAAPDPDDDVGPLPWPEGQYLVRMATGAPGAVAAVLREHRGSEDPLVQRCVLQAAAQMPAEHAVTLTADIATFVGRTPYLPPTAPATLIRTLLAAGHLKPARKIIDAVYVPRAAHESDDAPDILAPRPVSGGIDPYTYVQTLPEVATALVAADPKALRGIASWLATYQTLTGRFDPDRGDDVSAVWRPTIRPHPLNWHGPEDLDDALVDTLRTLTRTQLLEGRPPAEIAAALDAQPVLIRILIEALATVAHDHPERWTAIATQAAGLLLDPAHLNPPYRPELAALAQAALPRLTPAETEQFTSNVLNGPAVSDDDIAAFLTRWPTSDSAGESGGAPVDVPGQVQAYRRRWRRDVLAAIGAPALPAVLAEELAELEDQLGSAEHSAFTVRRESHTGPTSPLGAGELLALTDTELLDHLAKWRPEPLTVFGPSLRGQAHTLATAAAQDPTRFAGLIDRFAVLPVGYTWALLYGLRDKTAQIHHDAWPAILHTITDLASTASNPPEGTPASTEPMDGAVRPELGATEAKLAGAALIASTAVDPDWALAHAEQALDALEALVNDPNPTTVDDTRLGQPNGDSVNISLNTIRPTAMRALAVLAGHQDLPPAAADRALAALDRRWGPSHDASPGTAVAIGEGLRWLLDARPAWTLERIKEALGDPEVLPIPEPTDYIDTVWSMLLTDSAHPKLYELLRPWFRRAVNDLTTDRVPTEAWRRNRTQRLRLGDHLLDLVVSGSLAADDPLVTDYFTHATIAERAQVIGYLGWALATHTPSQEALQRAMAFVDTRTGQQPSGGPTELDNIARWTTIQDLPSTWLMPLLARATKSPAIANRNMILRRCANDATAAPADALAILTNCLGSEDDPPELDFAVHDTAPAILAAALDSGDQPLVNTATDCANQLGRSGFHRLDEEIARERATWS